MGREARATCSLAFDSSRPCGTSTIPFRFTFNDPGNLAEFQNLIRGSGRKQMHGTGYDTGPAGLVARTKASPVVAVEVFVERDVIAPIRVFLKYLLASVDWTAAVFVFQEDAAEPARDFLRDLIKIHLVTGASRALDDKVVTVIGVVLQQRADDEHVDWYPDRAAPI